LNGEWIEFPAEREAEIIRKLESHGYSLRHDPKLVSASMGGTA